MLFHILAHVNADHVAFGTEVGGSQCLAKFRLACRGIQMHVFMRQEEWDEKFGVTHTMALAVRKYAYNTSNHIPVPVVPQNKKLAMGRFGSRNPLRARRIALATELTALACPLTRTVISSSRLPRRFNSSCSSLPKGIDVHSDKISAIDCSETSDDNIFL